MLYLIIFCLIWHCIQTQESKTTKKMNKFNRALLASLIAFTTLIAISCDKCDNEDVLELGPDKQFFTVTYVDSNGYNALDSVFNTNNVSVFFKENASALAVNTREDFTDSIIGPFTYTRQPGANNGRTVQLGQFYDYYYIINVDTFMVDTFNVRFYPNIDECSSFMQSVEIFRNGNLVSEGEQIANLTVPIN